MKDEVGFVRDGWIAATEELDFDAEGGAHASSVKAAGRERSCRWHAGSVRPFGVAGFLRRRWSRLLVAMATVAPGGLPAITMLDPLDGVGVTFADYRALAESFPSVGRVQAVLSGGGVLIHPEWVLTAAHVATSTANPVFQLDGVAYATAERHVLPGFNFITQTNDLALLRLQTPVAGVAPARLGRWADPDDILGETAIWVGYGLTGTGRTGHGSTFPSQSLAFTNVIDVRGADIGVAPSTFVSDFDSPMGTHNSLGAVSDPQPTLLEGSVTPGDSGGGVFVMMGGQPYLTGIIAFAGRFGSGGANGSYGDLSGATHLLLFEDWITDTSGVAFIPEPRAAVWLMGLIAGLALCFRRWKGVRHRVFGGIWRRGGRAGAWKRVSAAGRPLKQVDYGCPEPQAAIRSLEGADDY
jgi:hypothetical protein